VYCKRIEVEETLPLRQSILWPTKDISHVQLPEDNTGVHLGAFLVNKPEPIAVISLFANDLPQESDLPNQIHTKRTIRFRKFACDTAYQGKGIGTLLLEYTVWIARSNMNCALLWCDARMTTLKWYQKRGLQPFGDTFFKETVEYVRVKRNLS
jgi:GNAT superfamily N-acetyltransferase